MSRKVNWGDEEDEGDYETKKDAKGQKTRVKTKVNAKGQNVRKLINIFFTLFSYYSGLIEKYLSLIESDHQKSIYTPDCVFFAIKFWRETVEQLNQSIVVTPRSRGDFMYCKHVKTQAVK